MQVYRIESHPVVHRSFLPSHPTHIQTHALTHTRTYTYTRTDVHTQALDPRLHPCRYQAELAKCSSVRLLDLSDVTKQVPLPAPAPGSTPPVFVLGGEDDNVVDVPAVQELASYYGVEPLVIPGLAHDCMLDTRWQVAASELRGWLESLPA